MRAPAPTPRLFFDTINAFHRSGAVKAAIDLDLFTAIGDGYETVDSLSEHCRTPIRATRILCNALAGLGFLSTDGGRYELTRESAAFLSRRSHAYIGSAACFLASEELMCRCADLAGRLRSERRDTDVLAAEHPLWLQFARGMAAVMAPAAERVADLIVSGHSGRRLRLLDVAAGHGIFGIAVAARSPLAEIVALDWEGVLAVARQNAEAEGVGDRFRLLPGSALETDFGSEFDVVVLANFLHHFDADTCVGLLEKARLALTPGGRVVIVEFLLDEGRQSPPPSLLFTLQMLAMTADGEAYTFQQLVDMLVQTGFTTPTRTALIDQDVVVAGTA